MPKAFVCRPAAFFLLLSLLIGCRSATGVPPPPPVPAPEHVWLGIDDGAGGLQAIIEAKFSPSDEMVVHLVRGGRRALIDDLESGALDAIFIHELPAGDAAVWFNPVAVDGLALIVHPDNPVTGLTLAEAQALFAGQVDGWDALGGLSVPPLLLAREEGDSGRAVLRERLLAGRPLARTTRTVSSHENILGAVAADPAAIGYAMAGGLTADVRPLAVAGLLPDPNTTGTQQYALTIPLYFVAEAEPHGGLRALLAWLQSAEGQAQVGEVYGRVR